MASKYDIRCRLVVLLFSLLALGAAALSSANIRFAVGLRNLGKACDVDDKEVIMCIDFQTLQGKILSASVFGAIAAAVAGLIGIGMAVHPRLRSNMSAFIGLQGIIAIILLSVGGYNAYHAQGFQISFAKFASNDHIPYYSIVYFGSLAQAGYGVILIVVTGLVYFEGAQQELAERHDEQAKARRLGLL